jgi:hypothetical protein
VFGAIVPAACRVSAPAKAALALRFAAALNRKRSRAAPSYFLDIL